MTTETAIVLRPSPEQALAEQLANPTKLELIRDTIMPPNSTMDEFELFVENCRTTGLSPFIRQIYPMKSGGKNPKLTILVGIDGYRLIAQRTHEYDGQDGPYWCGPDGIWRDVWVSPEPPTAAKVVVYRTGASRGFTGIANYDAYVQTSKDWDTGKVGPNPMWRKMAANQLAKCAEALALRKAFPAEMSGIYTEDEMGQAFNEDVPENVAKPVSAARTEARKELAQNLSKAETQAQQREQEKRQEPAGEKPVIADPVKILAALPDWMAPVYAVLTDEGVKLSALAAIIGAEKVTKNGLDTWAQSLGEDTDPMAEMLDRARATGILKPLPSLTVEVIDPDTGEISQVSLAADEPIEGEIVDEEAFE